MPSSIGKLFGVCAALFALVVAGVGAVSPGPKWLLGMVAGGAVLGAVAGLVGWAAVLMSRRRGGPELPPRIGLLVLLAAAKMAVSFGLTYLLISVFQIPVVPFVAGLFLSLLCLSVSGLVVAKSTRGFWRDQPLDSDRILV